MEEGRGEEGKAGEEGESISCIVRVIGRMEEKESEGGLGEDER